MHENTEKNLSDEARELVASLNGLAAKVMYDRYEGLTPVMRIRLGKVIRDTQKMLED